MHVLLHNLAVEEHLRASIVKLTLCCTHGGRPWTSVEDLPSLSGLVKTDDILPAEHMPEHPAQFSREGQNSG